MQRSDLARASTLREIAAAATYLGRSDDREQPDHRAEHDKGEQIAGDIARHRSACALNSTLRLAARDTSRRSYAVGTQVDLSAFTNSNRLRKCGRPAFIFAPLQHCHSCDVLHGPRGLVPPLRATPGAPPDAGGPLRRVSSPPTVERWRTTRNLYERVASLWRMSNRFWSIAR